VTPQSFGRQLRRLRETRHVTLQQVAARTKVAVSFLESLESGECGRWPGGIYGRGYVRAYADAIGVDPEEVVVAFAECYPAFAPDAIPDPAAPADEAAHTPIEKMKAAVAAWFRAPHRDPVPAMSRPSTKPSRDVDRPAERPSRKRQDDDSAGAGPRDGSGPRVHRFHRAGDVRGRIDG
jgi:transcriptional regulator with XRE-family HTH domain